MNDCGNHTSDNLNRREFLTDFGAGLGGLSLAALYGMDPYSAQAASPFAPKSSHFPVKAKAIIQLFASGAPSSVDTFDYKPELQNSDGKEIGNGRLLASPFKFPKFGKSGLLSCSGVCCLDCFVSFFIHLLGRRKFFKVVRSPIKI